MMFLILPGHNKNGKKVTVDFVCMYAYMCSYTIVYECTCTLCVHIEIRDGVGVILQKPSALSICGFFCSCLF